MGVSWRRNTNRGCWVLRVFMPRFPYPPDQARRAGILNAVSLVVAVALLLVSSVNISGDPAPAARLLGAGLVLALILVTQVLLRRGRVSLAGHLFTGVLWFVIAASVFVAGGVRAPAASTLVATVLIAGLALGAQAAVVYTSLSVAVLLVAYLLEIAGQLPEAWMTYDPLSAWTTTSALLVFAALILVAGLDQLERALHRSRHTAEALRASERKFSTLVRESPHGILSLSVEGIVQSFNPAAERISGKSANAVLGKSLFEAFELPEPTLQDVLPPSWQESRSPVRNGTSAARVAGRSWSKPPRVRCKRSTASRCKRRYRT
jgi:PAS domain S-box-containing protein